MKEELFGSDRMWGLKELPLPEPVSWFPAAPGWWVVAVLLVLLLAWGCWRARAAWRRRAYRRDALAELDRIAAGDAGIETLPRLLRRTALVAFARDEVASLRGPEWARWLNAHGGSFEPADAIWLERLPYDRAAPGEIDPQATGRLLAASRRWVREHRAVV